MKRSRWWPLAGVIGFIAIAVGVRTCSPTDSWLDNITDDSEQIDPGLTLRDVTLEQQDDSGQLLWKVDADEVTYSANQEIANLVNPEGEFYQDGELLYRVKAILKRINGGETLPEEFRFGKFYFNYRLHSFEIDGEVQRLSPKEADLLRLLLHRKNDLLSREEALETLWGEDNYFNARSMDVFISKLRKRFKPDPKVNIENVHGKGFRLVVEE